MWTSKRTALALLLACTCFCGAFAQDSATATAPPHQVVFTDDIDHFWEAYDSIQTTDDYAEQVRFINELYIDRGTPGLQAFRQVRDYPDTMWVKWLHRYPRFWASVRDNTLQAKEHVPAIEGAVARLREIYPELRPAQIYFCIGGLNTGGTVLDSISLIGAEVSLADATVDVSEFTEGWFVYLARLFQSRHDIMDNVAYINVHEYVHTQQHDDGMLLLSQVLHEGACDFIAELVLEQPVPNPYMEYGRAHHAELLARFREDLFGEDRSAWLYNGETAKDCVDLGYYLGYAICKAYYDRAEDKQRAVKEIIELRTSDLAAAVAFVNAAGVYAEPIEVPPTVLPGTRPNGSPPDGRSGL